VNERILVVDDEENIRRMMRLTLEAADCEVREASDGAEALNAFGQGTDWDVVLLDQRMPGMDGLAVLQKLKHIDPQVPVIMVTAFASIELAVDAMKLGASDFVSKPMTPEILRAAVRSALAKRAPKAVNAAIPVSTAPPVRMDIPILTLNGFEIQRRAERTQSRPTLHRFLVTTPKGDKAEISVEISAELVAYVERMTRRPLRADNSFWATQADHFLGNYLWTEGKLPPGNQLVLNDIDQSDLAVAARWAD